MTDTPTTTRLTVDEVARELLATMKAEGGWSDHEPRLGEVCHIASFVIRFAARREREVLERAAEYFTNVSQQVIERAAIVGVLRRLAAEVSDE